MRIAPALALVSLVACGTRGEEIRDAGPDVVRDAGGPTFYDARPGPVESDASAPAGIDCTPGTVRVDPLATRLLEGPLVDDGYVYWVAANGDDSQGYWWNELDGSIMRADKATFTETSIAQASAMRSLGPILALDPNWLFWVERIGDASTISHVLRASKSGVGTVALPLPDFLLGAIRVKDGRLYYADQNATTTRIFSAAADGSDVRLVADTGVPGPIAYDVGATQVFFAGAGEPPKRVPIDGGPIDDLVLPPGATQASSIEVGNDGFVYAVLTSDHGTSLVRIPTDGGTAVPLAAVESSARFVLDGADIYVSTGAGIFRMRDGTSPMAIGPGPALDAIAVDATTVRWATSAGMFAWCKLP